MESFEGVPRHISHGHQGEKTMTIKQKTHAATHFFAWMLLLIATGFWIVFFMVTSGEMADYMWWPSLLVGSITSVLFGMIFLKGMFE